MHPRRHAELVRARISIRRLRRRCRRATEALANTQRRRSGSSLCTTTTSPPSVPSKLGSADSYQHARGRHRSDAAFASDIHASSAHRQGPFCRADEGSEDVRARRGEPADGKRRLVETITVQVRGESRAQRHGTRWSTVNRLHPS